MPLRPRRWLLASLCSLALARPAGAEPPAAEQPTAAVPAAAEPLTVDVVGGGAPVSSRDPSTASTVIRAEELQRPGSDAADVLSRVPGVQVLRSGSSSDLATASLRGATSAQTPVYLAGVRLNDELTGTADLSTLPLWMLDRVEVFRGNAPADADRLGIGGAILFEPKLPAGERLGGGAQLGSFGERSFWLGTMLGDASTGALLSLRTEQADNDFDYVSDEGLGMSPASVRRTRRNADSSTREAWAVTRVTRLPEGVRLVTVLNAFEREQGEPSLGAANLALHSRTRSERLLGGVSARMPCPSTAGRSCELELTTTLLGAKSATRDPARELLLGTTHAASTGRRVTQSARLWLWPSLAGSSASIALAQELETLGLQGAGLPESSARRAVTRLAVSGRAPLTERLELSGVGALACHGTRSSQIAGAASCGTLAPEARLGARLGLSRSLELSANLGRYVRVPVLGELFGLSPLVRGNPALVSESGYAADAGLRVQQRTRELSLWAESFVFARFSRDLVSYRRAAPGYVRPYNTGRSRTLGLELASGLTLLEHLSSRTSLTLLDPRDISSGRATESDLLPHKSRLVLAQGLELFAREPLRGLPLDHAAVGAELRYRSSMVADPAGLIVISEQHAVDAYVALRFAGERLGVRLAVENVFDSRRQDLMDQPLPGRSVHVALSSWW